MSVNHDTFPIMLPSDIRSYGGVGKFRRGGALMIVIGIPWSMIAPHEAQARSNHSQSLERLAERGGLASVEALSILDDKPFFGRDSRYWNMDEITANAELIERVNAFIGNGVAAPPEA
jgi:hypothetical protein